MYKYTEFNNRINEAKEFLEEKLIQYNQGKKYGQVVFIAGGAGSGKGFAISQFMEGEKFKIRDVDEMKSAFLKLDKLKGKYPEIRGLDLRKPGDVGKLHTFVDSKGIKDRTLKLLLDNKDPRRLPNIIFDITAKDIKSITKVIPLLFEVGYDPRNIHLTWVLTNYLVAAENNANRSRVVPEKILMQTHKGAAQTMDKVIMKNALPRTMLDGGVYVVLNNRENTVVWDESDKPSTSKESRKEQTNATTGKSPIKSNGKGGFKFHVKSFSYLTAKKPGKPMSSHSDVIDQLKSWIDANAPTGWDKVD